METQKMAQLSSKQFSATGAFVQSAGAKLLVIGLNAATGILSARALAPAGRGELSAMILWYVFLANVFSLGLPSALTYRLRRHPEQLSELGGAALIIALVVSAVACTAGFFGMPHWLPQYSPQVLFFARLFLLNVPITVFVFLGRAAMESQGHFGASNLSLVGATAFTLVGLLFLLVTHTFTAVNAAWCYVAPGVPTVIWMGWSLYRSVRPQFANWQRSSQLLLSYGIRAYGIDLCGTLSLYVDQALVVRILRPSLMGTYVVALSLSRMLNAFHTAVVMVLFPRAVSRSAHEVLEMTGRAVRMTTLLTTLCGAGIMLAGPRLLVFLYGPEYRGATSILRILVIEVILAGVTQVLSQAFMALSRPGVITALQVIGLLLTIPLMLVLVPRFGIEGAALALLLSTTARFAFVLASFSRFLDLPHPGLLPRRADLHFLGSVVLRRWRGLQPDLVGGGV
jgi:O-antigen/teichoic acid export membrane protein